MFLLGCASQELGSSVEIWKHNMAIYEILLVIVNTVLVKVY